MLTEFSPENGGTPLLPGSQVRKTPSWPRSWAN
jgi:hypothetical protein